MTVSAATLAPAESGARATFVSDRKFSDRKFDFCECWRAAVGAGGLFRYFLRRSNNAIAEQPMMASVAGSGTGNTMMSPNDAGVVPLITGV